MRNSHPSRRLLSLTIIPLTAALTLGSPAAGAGPAVVPRPQVIDTGIRATQLPSNSYCIENYGIQCITPAMLSNAYNLGPLHGSGIDGTGRTIVIVDSFGSPTIANDLHAFDQTFGLPDPPSLTIIQPAGVVPPFDSSNSTMVSWAGETTLDVEWSHAVAPGAAIILVETPVAETEGVQGFPQMIEGENYVIDHDLGDVITQSFAATEETFPNNEAIYQLRSAYWNAARHRVTVLAAAGDWGASGYELNGIDFYPYRVVAWPASDPLVTAVGGSQLSLDDYGNRLAPDVVWNDPYGAGGGGVSAVFHRPEFQDQVRDIVGSQRGMPDISMNAACLSAVWVYSSYPPYGPGYGLFCGTSEASPEFAGIVAMADQAAGHRLGLLGPRLYRLGYGRGALVDITSGNNTFGPFTNSNGQTYTVIGYDAGPGYDLASGLGTLDATKLVYALARSWGEDD